VFTSRVWNQPQWIENLYFNYVVVLRAVTKLSAYLDSYSYCSGDPDQDAHTKEKVRSLITAAQNAAPSFDESRMFDSMDPTISGLKAEFRERFRNVSRIMDCVGCDKCRLWGKLQTGGYGTALKVLFEFDPERSNEFHLRRTEVVSLIVTFQRLSHSIWAVQQFREMIVGPKPSVVTLDVEEETSGYFVTPLISTVRDTLEEEFPEIRWIFQYVLKACDILCASGACLWRDGMVSITKMRDQLLLTTSMVGKIKLALGYFP
jgi:Endoplasmic Reticulum Oxidoreductin 1 (ERO1)